ncbi:MAG: hypothetical protein ACYDGN_04665 [Acidimicrobiales bacterium]
MTDEPGRDRVLGQPSPAVRGELPRSSMKVPDSLAGELLANVVELAIEPGERPGETLGQFTR